MFNGDNLVLVVSLREAGTGKVKTHFTTTDILDFTSITYHCNVFASLEKPGSTLISASVFRVNDEEGARLIMHYSDDGMSLPVGSGTDHYDVAIEYIDRVSGEIRPRDGK